MPQSVKRARIIDHRFITGGLVALCLLFLAFVIVPPLLSLVRS